MFSDYSKELLRTGIIEVKAGNLETGRNYLDRALYLGSDPDVIAEAWFWMSEATQDAAEKRKALENCLANDLEHARARRALAILDGRLRADEIVNPDMPVSKATAEDLRAQRYVCPRCGGRRAYSPDGHTLICEYCRRHQIVNGRQPLLRGEDFIVAMATRRGHDRPLKEQVLSCQGCGAEFIRQARQLSFTCPYCGSALVLQVEQSRELIAPDGVIPQALDQRGAERRMTAWLRDLGIQPEEPPGEPRGLYLPAWTFTLGGGVDYTAEAATQVPDTLGRHRSVPAQVRDRYPVATSVTVVASNRASAPFARLLPSYDLGQTMAYNSDYLAAWPAELYDVSMAEASLEARSRAYADLKRVLPSQIEPLRLISTSSASMTVESFRLDLLPVWISEIILAERTRIVLVNGQNGSVEADARMHSGAPARGMMEWLRDLLEG